MPMEIFVSDPWVLGITKRVLGGLEQALNLHLCSLQLAQVCEESILDFVCFWDLGAAHNLPPVLSMATGPLVWP